eukprot:scaffold22378_cov70-Phaeocystis_antarctica.AAC.1
MASGCPRQPRPPLQLRLLFLGVYAPGAHGTEAGAELDQGVSHGNRLLDTAWPLRCGQWLGAPPDSLDCEGDDGVPRRQRHAPSARQRLPSACAATRNKTTAHAPPLAVKSRGTGRQPRHESGAAPMGGKESARSSGRSIVGMLSAIFRGRRKRNTLIDAAGEQLLSALEREEQ